MTRYSAATQQQSFFTRPLISWRSLLKNSLPLFLAYMLMREIMQQALIARGGVMAAKVFTYGGSGILFLLVLIDQPKFISTKDIKILSFWSALLLFSILRLTREENIYLAIVIKIFTKCYLMYFVGRLLGKRYYPNLMKIIQLCPIIAAVSYILLFRSAVAAASSEAFYGEESYSQSLGYYMLVPFSVSVYMVLHKKFWHIPLAVILLFGILGSGARGPLLCAGTAIFIFALHSIDIRSTKSLVFLILCSIVGIWFILNYLAFLEQVAIIFKSYNISTRTIDSIIDDSFVKSDGRIALYKTAFKGILENPFMGVGLFRNRQYLFDYANMPRRYNISSGYFTHNIFLEVFMNFGIIIGSYVLFRFIKLTFKSYKISKINNDTLFLYIVFFCYGFMPLVYGGDWVSRSGFYLFLGFMFSLTWSEDKKEGFHEDFMRKEQRLYSLEC